MKGIACTVRSAISHVERTSGTYNKSTSSNGRRWLFAGAVASFGAALAPLASSAEERRDATIADSSPQESSVWRKLTHLKDSLLAWRPSSPLPSSPPSSPFSGHPLPLDKLKCHRPPGGSDPGLYRPVVLVSCGSFNPPTYLHLRMMELAREGLMQAGYDVLGGYLSPVNDAYWKEGLAPGGDRVRMCQLATADSDSIMVDPWEVQQRQYTRTLHVLRHVDRELSAAFDPGRGSGGRGEADVGRLAPPPPPRTMLVCGADVVLSMADPKLWRQDLLEDLLSSHGLVCISREGSDVGAVLQRPGTLLHSYRSNVVLVKEPVTNDVSSSKVRQELQEGRSVKYLIPESVIQYIQDHALYRPPTTPTPPKAV